MLKFPFQFLKELYLTGFTLGFRCRMPKRLGGGWGSDVDAGKGVIVLTLITLINFSNILDWFEIHVGTRSLYHSAKWMHFIAFAIVFLANYYVLIARGYGIKFEHEFNHLTKARKVFLITSSLVLLLAMIVFSINTVSAYRQYFHIPAAPPWKGHVYFN